MAADPTAYLDSVRACYPSLVISTARWHNTDGQFNEVLFVNDDLIFRFPRAVEAAAGLALTVRLLDWLRPRLPLRVPWPVYCNFDRSHSAHVFMGYRRLPGRPLSAATLEQIHNDDARNQLAQQLAGFLQVLHHLPIDEFGLTLPVRDGRGEWAKLLDDFRTELFPFMRPDACVAVTAMFERGLNDPEQFNYRPALRHGDFGPNNILYDEAAHAISGIIDFDSLAVGDPALDAGAILNLGEDFFRRICHTYPQLGLLRQRAEFYRSTYALQEALHGLRYGVPAAFEAGIAEYR